MEIPLKKKYRTYRGRIKRGAPQGNGDGRLGEKKHKLPDKQKKLLKPQPTRIMVYDAARGKAKMTNG